MFYNINNFRIHVYRNHFDDEIYVSDRSDDNEVDTEITTDNNLEGIHNREPISVETNNSEFINNDESHSTLQDLICIPSVNLTKKAELSEVSKNSIDLLLSLSTKHHCTEPAIQEVVTKSYENFQLCKDNYSTFAACSNLSEEQKTEMIKCFNDSFKCLTNAFDSKNVFLRSTYTRRIYYKDHLNLILPIEVELFNEDSEGSGFTYSYVPILETLGSMLFVDSIRQYCEKFNFPQNGRLMFDIADCELMKNNDFIKSNSNVIQLLLFQDAFEVCNPLGSAKKKYKIVAMYMALINLPPYLRTKVENVQLVFSCLESHIAKFGWDKILEKVIYIRKLETEGITIFVNGVHKTFFGTLIAMLGDNLGSHQIGGYCSNFSTSHYFCRYCQISRKEFHENIFCERILRTSENYKETLLKGETDKKANMKGILNDSPLNKLNYYHVANTGLPPCIAHNLPDGILKVDLFLIMEYFIKKQ